MSDKFLTLRLQAEVNQFVSRMRDAAKATRETAKAAEDSGKSVTESQKATAAATDKSTEANKKHGDSGKESAKGSEESAKGSKSDAEAKARQAEAAKEAGQALLVMGTASVAALGASTKAAMDWESAWAGVTKTVDGTPEQMAEVESGLRTLAKTLPSTHTEIAAVAEAAGQLGVKREDILAFTKTMVDLGETTNLTADEAATNIAQIANVMQTSGDDVDNFGSTLVALGNAGASTEKDILSMAQRIAGAGKLVGASESDVLALSNTLASMGVNAELGGGVTTRVLLKLYTAVQNGGRGLENFAKVAGVTSQQFAAAFSTSPVAALDMVTKGLARTKAEGGNVVSTMTDLGIKGTEETQVMLSLVGAGNLLTDSLKLGNQAWEENTALTDEANKRYETTASQVKVAWNNIKDAAIDAGAVILPVVSSVAENVTSLAQTFGGLPQPVQQGVVALTGVVGVAALVGGTLLTTLPKIRDAADAFKDLNTRSDGSSRGLGKMAKGAGIATAGLTALIGAAKITDQVLGKGDVSVSQFTQGLISMGKSTESLDALFKDGGLGTQINGVGDAIARINDLSMFDQAGIWLGDIFGGSKLNTIRDNLKGLDTALTGLVSGGKGQEAATAFQAIAKAADAQGVPVSKLVDLFPEYRDKLLEAKNAAGETGVTQDQLADAMLRGGVAAQTGAGGQAQLAEGMSKVAGVGGGTVVITKEIQEQLEKLGINAQGAVTDIEAFTGALISAGLLTLSSRDATDRFNEGLDALDGKIKNIMATEQAHGGVLNQNRTDFDSMSEAGRAANAVLADMMQRGLGAADAMAKNGESQEAVQGQLNKTYDASVLTMKGFGLSEEAASALTREILHIPAGVNVRSWMDDQAKRMAQATTGELDKIDGRVVTARSVMIEETHRINYEKRVVESGGNEPDGGGLYGSGRGAPGYATGGAIAGPGTGTSDSVPILASNGEHMFTAQEVDLMGGHAGVYRFRANLRSGGLPAYAGGGAVMRSQAASSIMAHTMQASAPASIVEAPNVRVFIGNEQIDARIEVVAGAVVHRADAQAALMRTGRR
ncbi:phage tail tape measure protein [Pseudarthrobacter equi]|uniref:phage tail tape measure protein n=1 Tax=Pseudarthrobacter equi TaxID=728066 RepID=UPI0021C09D7D|nr:phage tail tape measure protein [Pseudarthrobacter equi]MCT9624248.1 phage tail tape measure protein [Pseudarthrobacter equi]